MKFDLLRFIETHFSFLKNIPFLPNILDEQLKIVTFLFRPKVYQIMIDVVNEVKSWNGITTKYHKFGGLQFNVGNREIGHMHSNGLIDIPFTRKRRDAFLNQQIGEKHHALPNSGWISYHITPTSDIEEIITLLSTSIKG